MDGYSCHFNLIRLFLDGIDNFWCLKGFFGFEDFSHIHGDENFGKIGDKGKI